jgi:superfamily I DNA/RNA helicase
MSQLQSWFGAVASSSGAAIHSAKGLEFDHVISLGLGVKTLAHGPDDDDDQRSTLRRLLAMGIGRARKSVVLGYKPGDESPVVDMIDKNLLRVVKV